MSAIESEARKLADKSPDLALATAQTDIRREMAEFRRAQQLGPSLARWERVRSKFETAAYDLWTEIKEILLKIANVLLPFLLAATEVMKLITAALDDYDAFAAAVVKAVGAWAAPFLGALKPTFGMLKAILDKLDEIARLLDTDTSEVDDFTKAFLDMGFAIPVDKGSKGPDGKVKPPIRLPPDLVGGTSP